MSNTEQQTFNGLSALMGKEDAMALLQESYGLKDTLPPLPVISSAEFTPQEIFDNHMLHAPWFSDVLKRATPFDVTTTRLDCIWQAAKKSIAHGGWMVGPNKLFLTNLLAVRLLSAWSIDKLDMGASWESQKAIVFQDPYYKGPHKTHEITIEGVKFDPSDLAMIMETFFSYGGFVQAGARLDEEEKVETAGTMVIYGTGRAEYLSGPGVVAGYLEQDDYKRLVTMGGLVYFQFIADLQEILEGVVNEIEARQPIEQQGLLGSYGHFIHHVNKVAAGLSATMWAGKFSGHVTYPVYNIDSNGMVLMKTRAIEMLSKLQTLQAKGAALMKSVGGAKPTA